MEILAIALICAAAFGGIVAISAFVRQLIVSRDKTLNDKAQERALKHEAKELETMRQEMNNAKRFDSHHRVLGNNKDAIVYLDNKIEDILAKKSALIERYGQVTFKESGAIIKEGVNDDRKESCSQLKLEIDKQIGCFNEELKLLQQRRLALWDTHKELQEYLLGQEQTKNNSLDGLYDRHTNILEKVYMRHADDKKAVATASIEAGNQTFKEMVMSPVIFLMGYFKSSTNILSGSLDKEKIKREAVDQAQNDLNETGSQADNEKSEEKDLMSCI